MEVTHQNGNLRACDDQNRENERQEPKDVVDAVEPDAVHDEEQLDEDCTEGEDSPDECGDVFVQVCWLWSVMTSWLFIRFNAGAFPQST